MTETIDYLSDSLRTVILGVDSSFSDSKFEDRVAVFLASLASASGTISAAE